MSEQQQSELTFSIPVIRRNVTEAEIPALIECMVELFYRDYYWPEVVYEDVLDAEFIA